MKLIANDKKAFSESHFTGLVFIVSTEFIEWFVVSSLEILLAELVTATLEVASFSIAFELTLPVVSTEWPVVIAVAVLTPELSVFAIEFSVFASILALAKVAVALEFAFLGLFSQACLEVALLLEPFLVGHQSAFLCCLYVTATGTHVVELAVENLVFAQFALQGTIV